MITIITGTNRRNSEALAWARNVETIIKEKTEEAVNLVDLAQLNGDTWHADMYESDGQSKEIARIQDEWLLPSEKFFFVIPEYNGSFPGALKLFIDAVSVRNYKKTFKNKKAAMIGIASGRAGNLRGLEHLTGILNHLGIVVHPNRLPISSIERLTDEDGSIIDPETRKVLEAQIEDFLYF